MKPITAVMQQFFIAGGITLFFLLAGCSSMDVDTSTASYKQAEAKYQEGLENKNLLVKEGGQVLEAFDKDVCRIWEEGLKINKYHRPMRRSLAKLYLVLGEKFTLRGEKKLEAAQKKSGKGPASHPDFEKGQQYLKLALKHLKILRQMNEPPSPIDLYMARAYLFMDQYEKALAHLRAAQERGDLDPDRQKRVQKSIQLVNRLMKMHDF
ncbi:MAG: hypothetical protein D6785_09040 [Planctomycetota bacterium]|nr:MAG: hypothetical protein D6785_09040 [Planctomycetota bacterium]